MSKAGVAKTQGFREPRKRKKVTLEERLVDGGVVVGKECTKCGEWKRLEDEFNKSKKGLGGKHHDCKECQRKYRIENKEGTSIIYHKWYEENKETHLENCRNWRIANQEKVAETSRKYRENNKDREYERARVWKSENPDRVLIHVQNRRARKKALPATWTIEQKEEMLDYFGRKCALTGESKITEEHAIPLSIGHGGTIHGNMWPLCLRLNSSKFNKNIFDWFEANRQRFELSQAKFDRLIAWLAAANEMTVEEYRDYVYWCHTNPNDVLESEAI
ncbi:hypothetical protein [Bacillus sp. UNC437CL72CviS29]|uniref:hypothetical protein n=1 Tax=Bacillus sp. UNC437CL72CviS29 TaxID=1340430 RepID=UPI00047895C3|nr:hypothetical protein [Bacillus sp. UNC437CL72CviS29]